MSNKKSNYWLLNGCRKISNVRRKCLNLPTASSKRFHKMIGLSMFTDHYKGSIDTDELHTKAEEIIQKYDKSIKRLEPGDLACLCCETHRAFSEFKKMGLPNPRSKLKSFLKNKKQFKKWLQIKKKVTQKNNSNKHIRSIVISARFNAQ